MEFSRQEYWSGLPCPPSGDLPNPGIKPRSPTLQVDSLPSAPPGKLKNIGVGSLSLLPGIFPTQESNWGLLHCRQILYQLSYQRSPKSLSLLSHIQLFATPWTVASLSMELPRQEHWSGLPFPPPGDLPDPGFKPRSPALQADSLSSEPPVK